MKLWHSLACLPLLLSAAAWSQEAPGGGQQPRRVILQALDTDGNGQLSAAEIAAASASLLKLDKNHDGQLTPDEYNPKLEDKGVGDEMVRRMMLLDRNGDGVLTKDEVPERMQALFDRGDANHDGKLTPLEIRAMSAGQADPQGRRENAAGGMRNDPVAAALDVDHDGVLTAAEIASAPGALKTLDKDADGTLSEAEMRPKPQSPADRAAHIMDEWDTNKDHALSKAEMPDRMQPQFEVIDANHDGQVTLEELTAYMSTMPQGQGRGGPGGAGPRPADGGTPVGGAPPAGPTQ